ncbi:MAG: ferrous iron transport protein B [Firmicutes bacterium]|nr:ferrous iron transport protein B [Bacillota bacterium]
MEYKIALAGNPNVGKTSLFNCITHSSEHIGNWHGVTVKEKTKSITYDHNRVLVTDLPGLYSLTVYSREEEVTRDSVLTNHYDAVICVCEVNNLSRNLYLALQLLELGVPLLIAINMMDELKKRGHVLNYRKIEQALKIPIVPLSAKYHSDVHLLTEVALDLIKRQQKNSARLTYLDKLPLAEFTAIMGGAAEEAGFNPKWAAIKLMENDSFVASKLSLTDLQASALATFGDLQSQVARARYDFIEEITSGAISKPVAQGHLEKRGQNERYMHGFSKSDKIFLNKYLALPLFFVIMLAIFVVTFSPYLLGYWLSEGLSLGIEYGLYKPIYNGLSSINTPAWVISLLCDGIIAGLGGILEFLPQIVLLFFFLALLEDSGYLSRVAFMFDGLLRKIGLSGRSVFTMLMGFGCTATAVLTARGLEDEKTRKKTVLLTSFMSCGAKVPVYIIIAGAFFLRGSALIVFALYLAGIAVAVITAAIFDKIKPLKSGKLSFIMEMPPYRLPAAKRVGAIIWKNAKAFLIRIATVIFALHVIIWLLASFSFTHGFVVGTHYRSILEHIAGFIAPLFSPLGFGNWQAVSALIGGLAAKEVVVSVINSFGGAGAVFVGPYASVAAVSFLVFTLLYIPCIAALISIKKEAGAKWMLGTLLLSFCAAYLCSLAVYWTGRLFVFDVGHGVGILITVGIGLAVAAVLYRVIKKKKFCAYGCEGCIAKTPCGKQNSLKGKGGEE